MIWAIFWINVLTVVIAFKKRMILYGLLNAIFLFLVTGQAFQIESDLNTHRTVDYLLNFISDLGFNLGLRYVLGISIVSFLLALISTGLRDFKLPELQYSFSPSRRFYLGLFLFLSMLSLVLIFVVVGLNEFLHSSRPGFQSGSTIFLVLLFLGVVPLLLKILLRGKIATGDLACCLVTFGVTAFFSRTDLILYLITILLGVYYARGWSNAPFTPLLIAGFLLFGVAVASIIVVIGALHDAQNVVQGSLGDLVGYIFEHPEKSVLSLEYNYRVGIEGMSGIAGLFSQYLSRPDSVHHDYGLSWVIQGTVQWLPGFLKTYANSLTDWSTSLVWYPYSIVATGAETFFMSFGWPAIILYPLAAYVLGWQLPLLALQTRLSPVWGIVTLFLMACTIFFVHGALAVWIGFSFSYSAIVIIFWPIFKRQLKPTRLGIEARD
jgi:hypothetical protein